VTLPLGRAHLNDNEIVQDLDPETQHHQALATSVVGQDESLESSARSQDKLATILVVDDNEDMRQHIRRLLDGDYRVVTAQDGLLAEKALNEHLPDLIVTDLMMPNRNGLEFVESIKKNDEFAKIPVIMLTARAGLDDRIKGLVAAVDDYLVKPFNGRELKIRIKNLLNKQAQFNAFYQNKGLIDDCAPENKSETYIDKVKAVVNQRLMEPDFGVDELARALHISETTLRRRLSDHANFTPAAFIRHCRLEKARHLLRQGKMRSIAELANAVGFSQPSYFARLYERTFNCKVDIHSKPESI
jgi:DNA-binding response OmpR family regulator